MTRVLCISDNPELASFLLGIWREKVGPDASLDLAYSTINKSPEGMRSLGAGPIDVQDASTVERIMRDFDLILSVHCKRIFPARLVEAVRSVNLHPGYNPYNRGWYPQVFAILKDEPIGATLHEMVADIDAGPIIAQSRVELRPEDTSLSLYRRVIEAEKGLLENWLRDVVAGTYEARPPAQEGDYNSIADYRQLCALDPDHVGTLRQHIDLLRALSHPPFANAHFRDADGRRIHVRVELSVEDDPD